MPFADWPVADRALFTRATSSANYFDDYNAASSWGAKTRYQAEAAYGTWLAFLATEHPVALGEAPAARVTTDRAREHVEQFAVRVSAAGVAAHLNHLILGLRAIAPTYDWRWLRDWQRHWQRRARPRDRRQKIVHTVRLVGLGESLMAAAPSQAHQQEQARYYRDGMLIALLALRPNRLRAWSLLTIDKHVVSVGEGYVLVFPAAEMKTGQAEECAIPQSLLPQFKHYLAQWRLLIHGAYAHTGLWPSMKGGALSGSAIYDLVCYRTKVAFGFSVSPHLFRHCAASTVARDAPEKIPVATGLLMHSHLRTTVSHYTPANTVAAAMRHADVLAALRSRLTRGAPAARDATVTPVTSPETEESLGRRKR